MKLRAGIKQVGASTALIDMPSCAYAPDHNEIDQGATGKGRSIKAYVDKIGSESGTILLTNKAGQDTTTYTLTTSETIPSTVNLIMEHGAILDGAGTLTINGPFKHGLSQCFGSSITISFGNGAVKEAYPEWWYSGTGSWHTAIQATLNSGVGKIQLSDRTHSYSTRLDIPADVVFSGIGNQSVLSYTGAAEAIAMRYTATGDHAQWRSTIKEMKIVSDTGTVGILMRNVYEAIIEKIYITKATAGGFSSAGIKMDANGVGGVEFCNRIHQCTIRENAGSGIYFTGQNAHNQNVINECRIQGNQTTGIYAEKTVKGLTIIGNDIEGNGPGNAPCAEITFNNGAEAINIIGNWFETNADEADGIALQGATQYAGINIFGNRFSNNHATPLSQAIYMPGTHADGYEGIVIKGNWIKTHKYAIALMNKDYTDCDFTGNFYTNIGTSIFRSAANAGSSIVLQRLCASAVWDPGSCADGGIVGVAVTVTGAVVGDIAQATFSLDVTDLVINAQVTAANTVTVVMINNTGGAIDLGSGTLRVMVTKITSS